MWSIMKTKSPIALRAYPAALQRYLQPGSTASLQPALRLGRQAVARGVEMLELGWMHEQALLPRVRAVRGAAARAQMIRRAQQFFAQVIQPLEEKHCAARQRPVAASLLQSQQHNGRLLEQARLQQCQMRLLSHRLLSAQEDERKRISRELHDVIAQTLTAISVRLATLKAETTAASQTLSQKITHAQRLVRQSVEIVHQFARELRPPALDDLGLIPALHVLAKKFSRETGIRVRLTAFAGVETLSSAKRTVLYRVAQEAFANVARHAHASRVDMNVRKLPQAVRMSITDDGRSFEVERVLRGRKFTRLGLLGMRERVEMVGGGFHVESAPGQGTTICVEIPYIVSPKRRLQKETSL